jgi:hypothetical protein
MVETRSGAGEELNCTISIRGALDPRWSDWFDGLTITTDKDGNTLIVGTLPDPAALFGIISRVRDLGLELLSVRRD